MKELVQIKQHLYLYPSPFLSLSLSLPPYLFWPLPPYFTPFTFSSFHPFPAATYIFPTRLQVCPALSEQLRVFESLREKRNKKQKVEAAEKALSIQLADGQAVKGTAGVTTPLSVAQSVR